MKEYLYAVQDETGREVVSIKFTTDKVSQVFASRKKDTVSLCHVEDGTMAVGKYAGEGPLTLCRWDADDKLADPVSHPVAVLP